MLTVQDKPADTVHTELMALTVLMEHMEQQVHTAQTAEFTLSAQT